MKNKLGVRDLVKFTLRSGDLNPVLNSQNTPQRGAKIHRKIQKRRKSNFKTEYYLEQSVKLNDIDYLIHGRADLVNLTSKIPLIEEIKTSDVQFNQLPESILKLYWGQVKTYAHLLIHQNPHLKQIKLQLTYVQTPDNQITTKTQIITQKAANQFFNHLIQTYEEWLKLRSKIIEKRNQSAQKLHFPFTKFRPGQRKLASIVYKTIVFHKHLFAEAPTGTGKTISTLFPGIKAIGEHKTQRIFYLIAKQSTSHVVENTIKILVKHHLYIKSITITAKDKIQFPVEKDTPPEKNPYMLGYYDRLKPAMKDILNHENQITKNIIVKYAQKYQLDPFEFSLDVSTFCDIIICDYNYVFDPQVYLKRFFTIPNHQNCFLIDEAHNLVDRAREMYSATLSLKPLTHLIKITQRNRQRNHKIINKLKSLRRAFNEKTDDLLQPYQKAIHIQEPLISFDKVIIELVRAIHKWLPHQRNDNVLKQVTSYYFQCISYLKIADFYDHTYRTRIIKTNENIIFRQFCIDPSEHIADSLKLSGGAVLFSATLSPMDYYRRVLGNEKNSLKYQLKSPFPSQNLQVIATPYISTTYQKRTASAALVAEAIHHMIKIKPGHYLIFFPSNQYLKLIWQTFHHKYPQIHTIVQEPFMTEHERIQFLNCFTMFEDKSIVGFALMGGIFSEGIDLKGSALIGIGIVSVGLPKINPESNMVMQYFDKENHHGFEFAYQLPGLNHVLQAAGRLIRDSKDKGVITLIDARFIQKRYTNNYPYNWFPLRIANTPFKLTQLINDFWHQFK